MSLPAKFPLIFTLFITAISCRMKTDESKVAVSIEEQLFGYVNTDPVHVYIIRNQQGLEVHIINYGATITQLLVPDKFGKSENIVLGFDSLQGYLSSANPYFGATIGRYANRIAKASFEIDGKKFRLDANNNGHCLHGGFKGFDKVIWQARVLSDSSVQFQYFSPHGEGGFPGNLHAEATFSITSGLELHIDFKATTDAPTHVNLTSHSYFNLSGGEDLTILDHELRILASRFTEVNDELIPTGRMLGCAGTPFDFSRLKRIGNDIGLVRGGYDHNFILDREGEGLVPAAELIHRSSGRGMRIYTTQPGIQFYSGNFLDGTLTGRGGISYPRHGGLCLEPQHFPDSPNQSQFPSTLLKPGETYTAHIVYQFFTQ
jgi:aldose 1-epimerase